MRLAPLLLLAAAARAQYSADDTAPVTDAPTPTSPASLAPTVAAAVIFPAADSSWSHNGTAYLKYSLPNGVSPKSVSFVLSNENGALLKAGNSKNEELGAYFVFQKLMRSTAQPAGTGTYWMKWIPAYGENPDDVQPGTGYKAGVAYRVGNATEPLQFVWSAPFEIRADGADTLPADVSAYPANATASDWVPPNGPTKAAVVAGAGRVGVAWGLLVGVVAAVVVL